MSCAKESLAASVARATLAAFIACAALGSASEVLAQGDESCKPSELSRAVVGGDAGKLCPQERPAAIVGAEEARPRLRHKPYVQQPEIFAHVASRCGSDNPAANADALCRRAPRACMQFQQIERNEISGYLGQLEGEYGEAFVDEILQTPACQVKNYGSNVRSPLLHLTVDAPATRKDFLDVIYKYYSIKRKAPDSWLKAINARNDVGETFLDYAEHRINNGAISTQDTVEAMEHQIEFACAHGAQYLIQSQLSCPPEAQAPTGSRRTP